MESLDDEEIQRLIEQQLKGIQGSVKPEDDKDAVLYRLLFKELANNPFEIKGNQLAENVVRQIQMKQETWEQIYYVLFIFSLILTVSGLTYYALLMDNIALLSEISQFLLSNRVICLFIVLCFGLIQVLDKVLVNRNRQFK
jgi:Ca2+/Na+ antiporter